MPENDYDQEYYEGELNPSYVTASPVTKSGKRKLKRARGRAKTAQAIQTYMTDSKLPKSVLSERARNGDTNAYLSLTAQGRDEDTKRVLRFGAGMLGAGAAAAVGAAAVPVIESIGAGTFALPGLVGTAGRMLGNGLVKVGEYVSPVFNNPVMRFVFSRPVQAMQGAVTATPKVYNWVKNGEKPSTSEAVTWGLGTGLGVALGGNLGEASKAAYEIPGYLNGLYRAGIDLGKETVNGTSKLVSEIGIAAKRSFNPEYKNFTSKVIDNITDNGYLFRKPLISYLNSVRGNSEISELERMGSLSRSDLEGFADRLYTSLYNKNYNGIKAKRFSAPKQIVNGYYKMLNENEKPLILYFKNLEHARTPYGMYLSNLQDGQLYKDYALSRPTWKNWVGDGSRLSRTRIREYNNIYNSLSDADKKLVESFMEKTGLPMESTIQIMSPEYYNFLKTTKTPTLSTQFIKDGIPIQSSSPNPKYIKPLDTKYLRNFDPGFNWINPRGVDDDLSVTLKEINPNIDRFGPQDLDDLVNNVQYIGNHFPYASRIYTRGSQNYISGEGFSTPGAIYGSFRPGHSIAYTVSNGWPSGKLHYVTSAGRPLFSNNFHNLHDLNKYLGIDPLVVEYSPSSFNKEAFKYLHNTGHDWFGDIGIENQFAVNNPYLVKNLVGNNGNFDIKDINWFHKQGGKLIKRKQF